jgi:putative membrane protein
MELNYWHSTECTSAHYYEATHEWTVTMDRAGETIVLRTKQLVLATGMSGIPNVPDIPGADTFKGNQHHSSQHTSLIFRSLTAAIISITALAQPCRLLSVPRAAHERNMMLTILRMILVGFVALEHLYFLYLEMFAWTTPRVQRVFGTTPEIARASKVLAANQGLYNGFLAAGLLWGLIHPTVTTGNEIQIFFLGCVLVAALYGGLTAKRSILLIQGTPALLALITVLAA